MINIALIQASLPALLHGAKISLAIAVLSCGTGLMFGLVAGFMHTSKNVIARMLAAGYVYSIRGTPMLIQITFLYYVLPQLGIILSAFTTAVLAIGLNSGAYMSEAIRAGIRSVSAGQIEAARVLGFSPQQITWFITLPQALRITLPAFGNEFATLIKDSSLASVIGVAELYKEAKNIVNQTYDVITVFFVIALFYFVLTTIISLFVRLLERKLNWYVKN